MLSNKLYKYNKSVNRHFVLDCSFQVDVIEQQQEKKKG